VNAFFKIKARQELRGTKSGESRISGKRRLYLHRSRNLSSKTAGEFLERYLYSMDKAALEPMKLNKEFLGGDWRKRYSSFRDEFSSHFNRIVFQSPARFIMTIFKE
jgi:hypothetical protein